MRNTPETYMDPVTLLGGGSHAAGTFNSAAINMAGWLGGLVVLATLTDRNTSGTMDVKVQESDDGSTGWVDVPASALSTHNPGGILDEDGQVAKMRVLPDGRKQYLRTVTTVAVATVQGHVQGLKLNPNDTELADKANWLRADPDVEAVV